MSSTKWLQFSFSPSLRREAGQGQFLCLASPLSLVYPSESWPCRGRCENPCAVKTCYDRPKLYFQHLLIENTGNDRKFQSKL